MSDAISRLNAALEGRYRIERELGEGGMATVYLARDEKQNRNVALKVMKRTADLGQFLARFEAERRALAVMSHPSVARIFDAGTTAAGETFFVMEFVDGVPINRYCDDRKLTIRERARLLIDVCSAVQHAHQKGVIHRDLKPSNVLVSEVDGKPFPRIIDFGIAKATGTGEFAGTELTRTGQIIGTPAYMSPEQLDGSDDLDTRTDVYSLGVMLYELLVGALPYKVSSYRAWASVAAQIYKELPAPAERLADLSDTLVTLAAVRSTTPRQMRRELSGDLGWVALRAMNRDREHRYAAASDLGTDLDRFLRHEPIVGRAAGVAYVIGKFARRHRVGVGIAATAAVGVVAIAVVSTIQADRIAEARNRAIQRQGQAEDLLGFMVGDLRADLSSLGRLDLLDDVTGQALEYFTSVDVSELSEEELTRQAQVLTQLGEIRVNRLQYAEALAAFQEAYERSYQLYLARRNDGERLFARSQAEFWIGYISYVEGDWETADEWLTRYLESSIELRSLDPSRPDWMREVGFGYHNLAVLQLEGIRDLEAARDGLARAAAVWDTLLTVNPGGQAIQDRLMTLSFQADVARDLGAVAEYVGYHRETVADMRQALDEDPGNARWLEQLGRYLINLALAEAWTGRLDAALEQLEEAGRVFADLTLRDSTNQAVRTLDARAQVGVAQVLLAQGRIVAADSVVSQAVLTLIGLSDAAPEDQLVRERMRDAYRIRAEIELARGASEGALASIQEAILIAQDVATGRELVVRGEAYAALGQYDSARDSWRAAVEMLEPRAESSRAPDIMAPLARALLLVGRSTDGEDLLRSLSQMGYRPLRP